MQPLIAAPASDDAPGAAIDKAVQQQVKSGFSGVVLVGNGSHPILLRGYGMQSGRPVATNDRFWLASAGKQFVSAAIFKLAEQGKLDLDDRLSLFFPAVPPDKSDITVRQLLAHTSGYGQSYVSEGHSDRETAVRLMLAEPLKGPPGSQFRYSNSNTQLAAAVVEVASGITYPEFARQVLWDQAGLADTGFAGPEASLTVSPAKDGKLPPRLQRQFWGEQGAFSTADDLYRWYKILRSGKLLSEQSIEAMFAPAVSIGEGHATLGWFRGATELGTEYLFVRGNEDFGPNSLLYAYPQRDIVIIVLTHAGNADEDTSWSRRVLKEVERVLAL